VLALNEPLLQMLSTIDISAVKVRYDVSPLIC
jgi:hypothetical protein